jgi:hypothetical protein
LRARRGTGTSLALASGHAEGLDEGSRSLAEGHDWALLAELFYPRLDGCCVGFSELDSYCARA